MFSNLLPCTSRFLRKKAISIKSILDFQIKLVCIFLEHWTTEKFNRTIFGLKVYLFWPKSWQKYFFSPMKDHLKEINFLPFPYYQICGEKGWWRPPLYFPWELLASKISPTAALENDSNILIFTSPQNNGKFWVEKTQMKLDWSMMRGLRQRTSEQVEMLTSQPLTVLLKSMIKSSYLVSMSVTSHAMFLFLLTTCEMNPGSLARM